MNKQDSLDNLKKQLKHVPLKPGVYMWKNDNGDVIYVGKAKQLRSRMRQYINLTDTRAKIPLLIEEVATFEYFVVNSEEESLLLERQLIDNYKPYYNVDFKDDKSYPYIALTTGDTYPAIKYTREKHKRDTLYFGPYTDSKKARRLLDIIRKTIPVCSANCSNWKKVNSKLHKIKETSKKKEYLDSLSEQSPCFDCSVGIAPGVCVNRVTKEDYKKNITKISNFLQGSLSELTNELKDIIKNSTLNLNYEQAQRAKQKLDLVNNIKMKQNIVNNKNLNADVIGIERDMNISSVYILIIREGSIVNTNEFIMNKGINIPKSQFVHDFILKYYQLTTNIPKEIIVEHDPSDVLSLERWLTRKLKNSHGAKVRIKVARAGFKFELLKLANKNAKHSLIRYKVKNNYDDNRTNKALKQIQSVLAMPKWPARIECFDISTIHGSYTVASMVVFTNGRPNKSEYRRFKIKTPLNESNDFLSMQEVIKRRYSLKNLNDKKFGSLPDLIIVDGGKPQISAVIEIFKKINFDWKKLDVCICGIAKAEETLIALWDDFVDITLPQNSESLYLVKQIRDEAHRFAIEFHRNLRSKGMKKSILSSVTGIGKVRQKKLLRHFKSFKNLKNASLEDIKKTNILPSKTAEELYLVLKQNNK